MCWHPGAVAGVLAVALCRPDDLVGETMRIATLEVGDALHQPGLAILV